jgi:deoxyribodipyrimidine photo-lyase
MRSLVWFRADLRTADNPALAAAHAEADDGVLGVFLVADKQWRRHDWGEAKIDFTLRSVAALREELASIGVPLIVESVPRFVDAPSAIEAIAIRNQCDTVHFNREFELNEARRDERVIDGVHRARVSAVAHDDQTIVPCGAIRTGAGTPYTVFTPFKRAWIRHIGEFPSLLRPLARPRKRGMLPAGTGTTRPVAQGTACSALAAMWPVGEREAVRRLRRFVSERLTSYARRRDRPDLDGTSALSPYLNVGAISPRQCLAAALEANDGRLEGGRSGPAAWINELIWRDFYRHIVAAFPRVCMHRPFKPATDRLPWREDKASFDAWTQGYTGVPIVDAGMRQLAATGWMHNRVRMITAMFLSKHLLIDWRRGEQWFMRRLVDADLASNNGGWQWSASTGTDAAPYFRIFNPITQSVRFDPRGDYIRRHVSELGDVPVPEVHDPPPLLRAARGYPEPIVDLALGRRRAIEAYRAALVAS